MTSAALAANLYNFTAVSLGLFELFEGGSSASAQADCSHWRAIVDPAPQGFGEIQCPLRRICGKKSRRDRGARPLA